MTTTVESIVSQAMLLSDEERSAVVDRLVESFHHDQDELPDEMKDTLDRRWEEIVSGKVKCRDAFEVLDELRAKYNV